MVQVNGMAIEANLNPLPMTCNILATKDDIKLLGSVRNYWPIPWKLNVSLSTSITGIGGWVGKGFSGTVMKTVDYATSAAIIAPKVASAGLSWFGFTTSGVAAGSWAAAWQSSIGNVAATSAFAKLQAVGAVGGLGVTWPVGVTAGALAGGTYLGAKWWFGSGRGQVRADEVGVNIIKGAFVASRIMAAEAMDMGMDYGPMLL